MIEELRKSQTTPKQVDKSGGSFDRLAFADDMAETETENK